MNVYDEAHTLARAIKESEEFKHYEETRRRVDSNPELSKMLKDFQARQMELQAKQMAGEELSGEAVRAVQSLYEVVAKDPLVGEHLQNEMRLSLMVTDVYKIISEAVGIGLMQ